MCDLYSLDPLLWDCSHVQQWLDCTASEYSLHDLDSRKFMHVDGKALSRMSYEDFCRLASPYDADILIKHLNFIRQGKLLHFSTV